jgi:hypothetical protein
MYVCHFLSPCLCVSVCVCVYQLYRTILLCYGAVWCGVLCRGPQTYQYGPNDVYTDLYYTSYVASGNALSAFVRFSRLVRLVRLVAIFNAVTRKLDRDAEIQERNERRASILAKRRRSVARESDSSKKNSGGAGDDESSDEDEDEAKLLQESDADAEAYADASGASVGKKLSTLTTKRVITGVLIMVIIIPNLIVTDVDASGPYGVSLIHNLTVNLQHPTYSSATFAAANGTTTQLWQYALDTLLTNQATDLMYLCVNTSRVLVNRVADLSLLRANEILTFKYTTQSVITTAIFSQKNDLIANCKVVVGVMAFLVALIAFGAFIFAYDAKQLVIKPVERMVTFVKKLATNPLAKIKEQKQQDGEDQQFETIFLEKVLRKLGGLLQIGFGQAGAEVLGSNMSGDRLVRVTIHARDCSHCSMRLLRLVECVRSHRF